VVEYMNNHPKVEGLSSTAADITVSENDTKNIHSKIWLVEYTNNDPKVEDSS
jgi:hypothetical protein